MVQRLRLAIVSDAVYPFHKGGKEMRIHELSTRLAQRGYEVTIYTMKWWDEPARSITRNGVTFTAISKLHPLYQGERRSISQGILFGVACFRLIGEKFDVVDVDHMPYFPLFSMRLVAWLKRKPMLATWHEVWGGGYWREYLGAAGVIASVMERLSVLLPSQIVAVSEHTQTRLTRQLHARRPSHVVTNGIDLAAIREVSPSSHASDLMFVGRLLEHKNVDILLRSVALLVAKYPALRCLVVGDGVERERLERLGRELGIRANVTFLGSVPSDAEKFALMKASRVYVTPSTREGFGITVLEALACGLPVITTDDAANAGRLLVTAANGLVVPATPEAFATAIDQLLSRPLERDDVVATAEPFGWDAAAAALSEVYAS